MSGKTGINLGGSPARGRGWQDLPVLAAALAVIGGILWFSVRPYLAPEPKPRPDVIEGSGGWLYPGWEYLIEERPEETRRSVDEVVSTARALERRGIHVVLLIIPDKSRTVPDHLPAERRAIIEGSTAYGDMIATLRGAELAVVDAAPTLADLQREGRLPVPPRRAHWTAEAAEAVTAGLAAEIGKTDRIAPAGTGEKLPGWETERHFADLVEIQRQHGDNRYGDDEFVFRRYGPRPEGPAPVAIVGNSFVARQYGVPQILSNALDVRVKDWIVYAAKGPWTAMAQFNASGDAPRVVVWALQEQSFTVNREVAKTTP